MDMNIDQEIKQIEKELIYLDGLILSDERIKNIETKLYQLDKKILKIKIELDRLFLQQNTPQLQQYMNKIKRIKDNIDLLIKYINTAANRRQSNTLGLLAIIQMIFLPLSIVVGYFGMNFKSMGSPSRELGVFSTSHGQLIVWFLMIFSAIFTLVLLNYYYNLTLQNIQ